MKKLCFIAVLLLCFFLCSCGSSTPKSAKLTEKYDFYKNSISGLKTATGVTAEEADEIFISLVSDCGVDSWFTVTKNTSGGFFNVNYGINTLKMYLDGNTISEVFDGEIRIYPAATADASSPEESCSPSEKGASTDVMQEVASKKYSSISQLELDELQRLYLDFNSSMSYSDALEYIQNTGLPYSEKKYNGSRQLQVALTEGCTAQKYMKENGPYIRISYEYAKGENSINDDKTKYSFGTCVYNIGGYSLIVHNIGNYFDISTSGTYIKQDGNTLDKLSNLSKEEQLLYYFNNQ